LGYLQRASAWSSESPREHRRRQCVQIGLAGKGRVERRQPSRRLEQQRWRIASSRGDECRLRAQERDTCTLQVAEGACLRHGEKAERVIERTCLEFRLRCGEGPSRASRRFAGQRGSPFEESGGSGETAPRLRPRRGALEFAGQLVVGRGCGLRPVPSAPIRVDLRIGCVRQGAVNLAPLARLGRPLHRRAHEWMPEHHRTVQRQQAF
jgi:hypothetical protein